MDDVNERHERVLLRPWLEIMLETSSIPGLEWFDKERMMFKVPWKHRSKKDWSIRHSSVFLEWARNTGRWSDGDPTPYFAQLKTRLRCAFNKAPDIEEMKEFHSRNCEEPYKVYRFTTRKTDMKLCSRRSTGNLGMQRTTVPMTAPRRVASEMKAEMFADEDLHYTDVESVKTEFSYGYDKKDFSYGYDKDPGSNAVSVDKGQDSSKTNVIPPSSCAPERYFEYSSQGSSLDQKQNSGVIPITVEELSSAESDDSDNHKVYSNYKPERPRAVGHTVSQPVCSEKGSDGLVMLQVASLFVEAEASRKRSEGNTDQDLSKDNGVDVTAPCDVKCSTASQAIDLTRKDQLDDGGTQLPTATSYGDVIDLTSKDSALIEAVDLTQRPGLTDCRILPLARPRQNYTQSNSLDGQAVKTQLLTPVRMKTPLNQVVSDAGRGVTSLTIRSRPLANQPLRITPNVTLVSSRFSIASPVLSGRFVLASGCSSTNTESTASIPSTFTTVPIVTVHRASPVGASIVSFSSSQKPVPIVKHMMVGRMTRPLLTVHSEMTSQNETPEQLYLKKEPSTPTNQLDMAEIETSPSPSHNATAEEVRRHYRAKEQLLSAKAQALLDKEKQLIMWEKELLAKHESLYWKERCMQHERVQSSDGKMSTPIEGSDAECKDESNGDSVVGETSNPNAKHQFVCGVEEGPTVNTSPSIAALLKTRPPILLQARQTAPVVSMAVATNIDCLLRPSQPVRSASPVRIVTSPISPADLSCSGPRLLTQETNPMRFTTRGFLAPRLPTQRIVLRTTPMTQPTTQQKCLRILPAASNSRRVPVEFASEVTSEMVVRSNAISFSENRVLPPVYPMLSTIASNVSASTTRQLPLCVVETEDVSDEQESPDRELDGNSRDCNTEDVVRGEFCPSNTSSNVNGLNKVPDIPSAATATDSPPGTPGQVIISSSGDTCAESTGQGLVSLEQIRLTTERIVRQFQRQTSATSSQMSVGSCTEGLIINSTIECNSSAANVHNNKNVSIDNYKHLPVNIDVSGPTVSVPTVENELGDTVVTSHHVKSHDSLAVEVKDDVSVSDELSERKNMLGSGGLSGGDEQEVMGDKLVIADEANVANTVCLYPNCGKSCGELSERDVIFGKRKLEDEDGVSREVKILRSV